MPQDPDERISPKLFELLKREVHARNMHPPADAAPPAVLRGLHEIYKKAPQKATGIIPKEMRWDDPSAFSNTLAYVHRPPVDGHRNINAIETNQLSDIDDVVHVNPGVAMLAPQNYINRVMGHEVEHVWQNRNSTPEDQELAIRESFMLPYAKQPREIDAAKAAESYGFPEDSPEAYGVADRFLPTIQSMFNSLLPKRK